MKRYLPFALLSLIFLLTLLRASAGWAAPNCLEGSGWRHRMTIDGQFLTHIHDSEAPVRKRRAKRARGAPTAPPKHEGLDRVELWELTGAGPLAEPENRSAMLIEGENGHCDVSRISGKGTGRMEISLVPISREMDAVQVKSTYMQGSVQQTLQLYTVNAKDMKFEEIWSVISIQIDPATGKALESQVEYLDVNSDNYTDISLTDADGKKHFWQWNASKKRFDAKK